MIGIKGKVNGNNSLIIPYSLLENTNDEKIKSIDLMMRRYYSGKWNPNFFIYYIRNDKEMNPSSIETQVISNKWGIILSKNQLIGEEKNIKINDLKMEDTCLKDDPTYYFSNTPT